MYRIRPWLFIGNYRESRHMDLLRDHRISAMLHLAEDVRHPEIACLYLDVDDGVRLPAGALQEGVDFVRTHKAQEQRILIACGAGISRSVSFAIAVLHEEESLSLLDAYHTIWQLHPEAMPHPELWQSLQDHYHDRTDFMALLDAQKQWAQT